MMKVLLLGLLLLSAASAAAAPAKFVRSSARDALADPFGADLWVAAEGACAGRNCSSCADSSGKCAWCSDSAKTPWAKEDTKNGKCVDVGAKCDSNTLCTGAACAGICAEPCTNEIWPCSHQWLGEILLILFWGVILAAGAKIISDGSELLLDLFPAWGTIIGGLFLPVLGAIPDAAIIVVSGALGTVAAAQEQVAVGMGTLAGSTIMLLTVTWASSQIAARCDFNEFGEARDGVCGKWSWTKQGVTVDEDTPMNSKIMIITSLSYLIVQGVAFAYLKDPASGKSVEKPFALAGMIVCFVLLIAYCVYQVMVPKLAEKRAEKHAKEMAAKRELLRAMAVVQKWSTAAANLNARREEKAAVEEKTPEQAEAQTLGVGMMWRAKALKRRESEEQERQKESEGEATPLLAGVSSVNADDGDDDDSDDESEEIQANFARYLTQSIVMMIGGTAICAIFSDPMVSAISDFATTAGIPAFYISFIVTPYCSNASEFVSSLQFAAKKKQANTSMTYSQIYGAASMNNTMCLGIFFALVYFRGLVWSFSAETLSILVITWVMAAITFRARNFAMWWCVPVFALYPLSILLVWILEAPQVGINWT